MFCFVAFSLCGPTRPHSGGAGGWPAGGFWRSAMKRRFQPRALQWVWVRHRAAKPPASGGFALRGMPPFKLRAVQRRHHCPAISACFSPAQTRGQIQTQQLPWQPSGCLVWISFEFAAYKKDQAGVGCNIEDGDTHGPGKTVKDARCSCPRSRFLLLGDPVSHGGFSRTAAPRMLAATALTALVSVYCNVSGSSTACCIAT